MKEYKPDKTSRSLASSRQSLSGRDDTTVQTGETRYSGVDMWVNIRMDSREYWMALEGEMKPGRELLLSYGAVEIAEGIDL